MKTKDLIEYTALAGILGVSGYAGYSLYQFYSGVKEGVGGVVDSVSNAYNYAVETAGEAVENFSEGYEETSQHDLGNDYMNNPVSTVIGSTITGATSAVGMKDETTANILNTILKPYDIVMGWFGK